MIADRLVAVVSGQPIMASDLRAARALDLVAGAAALDDAALIDRLVVRELMRAEVERFSTTMADVDRGVASRADAAARTPGPAATPAWRRSACRRAACWPGSRTTPASSTTSASASTPPRSRPTTKRSPGSRSTSATTCATAGRGRSPTCATTSAPASPASGGKSLVDDWIAGLRRRAVLVLVPAAGARP